MKSSGMCGTCDKLRTENDSLSDKCQIYERRIVSLGKINAEIGSLLLESHKKIAKLNQVVALLTQQIAEKITENSMLRVESDMNKGGRVKESNGKVNENNCQLDGNNLEIKMQIPNKDDLREKETNKEKDGESDSEMEESESSEDVQMVLDEAENQETEASSNEKQSQICAWIVQDDKGTSGRCGRVFPGIADLMEHFRIDHRTKDSNGNYVCLWDGCKRHGEPFRSTHAIDSHFRTHSDARPYRCPFKGCDRAFSQSSALSQHKHTHSGTVHCLDPGCPKVFVHKNHMMSHYRKRHTGQRKGFLCPVEGENVSSVQHIAEKTTENTMLRLESDMNRGGKAKENYCPIPVSTSHCQYGGQSEGNGQSEAMVAYVGKVDCQLVGNEDKDVESNSEMENLENSDDVQVVEDSEDEETEATMDKEKLQTCAWMVSGDKGTSGRCGKVFPDVEDLMAHFRVDHRKKDSHGNYICSWEGCKRNGEPFKSTTTIDNHFRIHSGEKRYRCPFEGCGRAFVVLSTLRQHKDSHSRTKHPCLDPECPKVFSHKKSMMHHYRVRHSGEREGFACTVEDCGKVFETDQLMRKHRGTHRAEKPYRCKFPRCTMAFANKGSLDEHTERHEPGAKHKCPFDGCGRQFAAARYVREHVRATHTGEKPFVCPYECGMAFARSRVFRRHLKVHKNADTAEPPETNVVGTG